MKKIDNYYDAVHYLGNALILCNDITKIDPDFYADDYLGPWHTEDEDDTPEIYQYFFD